MRNGGGDKCCFEQFVRHGNRGKCWEAVRNGGGGGDKCCFDQFVRHGNRGKCWEAVRNGGEISVVLSSLSDMVTGENVRKR